MTCRITSPSPPGWRNASMIGASRSTQSSLTHTHPQSALPSNLRGTSQCQPSQSMPGPHSSCGTRCESYEDPSKSNPSDPNKPKLSAPIPLHLNFPQRFCPQCILQSALRHRQFWPTSIRHPTTPIHQTTTFHHQPTPSAQAHRPAHAHNTPSTSQNSRGRWNSMGSFNT